MLQLELSFIRKFATHHGFPIKFIDKIIAKNINLALNIQSFSESDIIYRKLDYVTGIPKVKKVLLTV